MKGILLVNIGSPHTASRADVKAFVGAMLSDPMVMTVPDWLRPILVKGIILPMRQFCSTSHYAQIWQKEENTSPLTYHMLELASKLEHKYNMPVEVGMRYLEPSITKALDALQEKNKELIEVVVLPLYPHYAESSCGTTVKEVERSYKNGKYSFQLRFIEPYFSHREYINTLVASIKPYLKNDFDKLIFNYHSLPLSHIETGWAKGREYDYVFQTKETTRLIEAQLNVEVSKIRQVYSSAMGQDWLKPSLTDTVKELAAEGNKRIVVVSPGFSVDNLETLYDIGIVARNTFVKHGGTELVMIPCLNSTDRWVEAVQEIIL